MCSREYGCVLGCRHVLVVSVSSSGVGTVFALLFFRLEKLLFYKGIFFQCSVFFCMPSSFHPFLVYGLQVVKFPNIFESLVCRVPFAPFLPSLASVGAPYTCALDARVSARVVHAKPSERAASFGGRSVKSSRRLVDS